MSVKQRTVSNRETGWPTQAEAEMGLGVWMSRHCWGGGGGEAAGPRGLVRLSLRASCTQQHLGDFGVCGVISLLFSCPQRAATARWAGFPASHYMQAQQRL